MQLSIVIRTCPSSLSLKTNTGRIIDYVGMKFVFNEEGQVRITMEKCIEAILSKCGVETTRVTPAASNLFDVRESPRATEQKKRSEEVKVCALSC